MLHSRFSLVIYYIHSSVCMCARMSKCAHAQLCPTLCDPMDCSPPGSSDHRIFPVRILEWVTISSSRRSTQGSNLQLLHWQADSLTLSHLATPHSSIYICQSLTPSFSHSLPTTRNHKLVFYMCDSISALQISFCVPFLRFHV